MTTIAYNHKEKEIAFDSRITRGGTIVSDLARKDMENGNGIVFILAGKSTDCDAIAAAYPDHPVKNVNECHGFCVDSGVKWLSFQDGVIHITDIDYNESAGSGQDHALTAMDMGATAKKAVQMAMKRDSSTGGKIRVIKIKETIK